MLDVISLKTPQRKWASSRLEGRTSWIFSSLAGALDLRRGLQGPALVASVKVSPHASCSGASRDSSPVLTWILGYFWCLPRGVSTRLEWGHARALSSRAVTAVSRFPSRGSRDLWLSLEAFPRGFPTRLSHRAVPRCHRGESLSSALKSRQCRENSFPWNGLRHLGDSGNGVTTLEFLSPFLWRASPLVMRRERREFFPVHAGKGSLLSS